MTICMRTLACAFVLALAAAQPAGAQSLFLQFFEQPAADLVKAGLSEPYGKKIAAAITEIVKSSAAPGCAQPQPLAARVDAILQRRGTEIVEMLTASIDRTWLRDGIAERNGAGAQAEREQLKSHPVVREYIALGASRRAAETMSLVAEQFGRLAIYRNLKLARNLPDPMGAEFLELDPFIPALDKMDAFQDQAKSPHLDRYVTLTNAAQDVVFKLGQSIETMKLLAPSPAGAGFEADFAELCIKLR